MGGSQVLKQGLMGLVLQFLMGGSTGVEAGYRPELPGGLGVQPERGTRPHACRDLSLAPARSMAPA